jgi:hypothetical protein
MPRPRTTDQWSDVVVVEAEVRLSAPPGFHFCRVLSLHRPIVDLSVAEDRAGMAATADLTFPDWDTSERGPLEEFLSRSVEPTPREDVRRAGD